jgi:hypothetical protein
MARSKGDELDPIMLLTDGNEPDDGMVEDQIRAEFNKSDDQAAWRIKVSRFLGNGKQEPECFECTPADFPITERIREDHGAGQYRVRVWKDGKLHKYFQYSIEAAKRPAVDMVVKNELGTLAASFQAAFDRQTQMIERLLDKLSTQRGPGNDANKAPTITELVSAMVSMKEFIAPKQDRSGPSELLQIFKLGLEAGSGGTPIAEGTGILGSLERILSSPLVQKIAEGAMSAMPAPVAPGTQPPPAPRVAGPTGNGGAARAEPQATVAAPTQEQQVQIFMRQQLLYLLGRAHQYTASNKTKSHPDLYAEWVVDNIPIEILGPIVASPNALQMLTAFVPEVTSFSDWFSQLLESVRIELTGDGEEGDNGASLANGQDDASSHVSGATESGVGVFTGRP